MRRIDQLYSGCLFIRARSSSVSLPVFFQDRVGDSNFADVMEQRRDFKLI